MHYYKANPPNSHTCLLFDSPKYGYIIQWPQQLFPSKNAEKLPPPPFPDHYCHTQTKKKLSEKTGEDRSLPETNIYIYISHLWKGKFIFPSTFKWDMLVSRSFNQKNPQIFLNEAKTNPPTEGLCSSPPEFARRSSVLRPSVHVPTPGGTFTGTRGL